MVKVLTKTGNSLALVLDKKILAATKITAKTPLEVTTDGNTIVITPARDKKRQAKLKKILAEMHKKYGEVFRRLAE